MLAITRGDQPIIVPTGREILRAGDTLALAGAEDAVEAATRILSGDAPPVVDEAASTKQVPGPAQAPAATTID